MKTFFIIKWIKLFEIELFLHLYVCKRKTELFETELFVCMLYKNGFSIK